MFLSGTKIAIFRGGSDASFKQDPDIWTSFEGPKSEDDGENKEAAVRIGDINGDGRADLVFSRIESKGITEFKSRIWIHLAKPDGSYPGKPDVLINKKGIGGLSDLKDLNGDGRDDMVIAGADIGVGTVIGMLVKGRGTVDVAFQLYLSKGRSFPEKPDGEFAFQFEVNKESKNRSGPVSPVFGWDFDSDGKPDLATVDAKAGKKSTPDRLIIRRGSGSGAKFSGTIWKSDLQAVKSLTPFRLRPGQPPSLLVQLRPKEKHQGDVLVLRNLGVK